MSTNVRKWLEIFVGVIALGTAVGAVAQVYYLTPYRVEQLEKKVAAYEQDRLLLSRLEDAVARLEKALDKMKP